MPIQDISFRIVKPDGHQLFFPNFKTFTLSPILNDAGSIEFTATREALNFDYLYTELSGGRDVPCAFYLDGVHHPEYDFYVTDFQGDDIAEGADWTFSGLTMEYRLEDALTDPRDSVIPPADKTYQIKPGDTLLKVITFGYGAGAKEDAYQAFRANNPDFIGVTGNSYDLTPFAGEIVHFPAADTDVQITTNMIFDNRTAGYMMKFYMDEAANRGCFTDIVYSSFDANHDSNGDLWDLQISIQVAPGLSYLDFAKALVKLQLADFQMLGKELRLYKLGALSTDRTLETPPLVFRRGRDLIDSPRNLSVRDSGTSLTVAGADGFYDHESDGTALANRGRRIERYNSQGSIADAGTLTAYAQQQLPLILNAKMEKTNGLSFAANSKQPILHFLNGDWVFTDIGRGLERYRVVQWTLAVDENRQITGSATLNDFFADRDQKLVDTIEGITQGTTILGGTSAQPVTLPGSGDTGIPGAPTGLAATSSVYVNPDGSYSAAVAASWDAVTIAADGVSPVNVVSYDVLYELPLLAPGVQNFVGSPSEPTINFSGLPTSTNITIYVRAVDETGYRSPDASLTIAIGNNTAPPATPSTPVCDNYLGMARAHWDGKDSAGASMAPDFDHIEVHWGATSNFTPTTATLSDNLRSPGYSYKDAAYGVTIFCRFIAVDRAGNKSGASAQGSAVPDQVVSADVFDGAIGTAKLADLAVTNAKIGNLAVNDAKVGSLSVGKLTTGTMSADMTVSGRIATALSGARCLFDATGIHLFNSVGSIVVDINTSGAATFTGAFATAFSGTRVVIQTDGSVHFYQSATEVGRILPLVATVSGNSSPVVVYGDAAITSTTVNNGTFNGLQLYYYNVSVFGVPTDFSGVVISAMRHVTSDITLQSQQNIYLFSNQSTTHASEIQLQVATITFGIAGFANFISIDSVATGGYSPVLQLHTDVGFGTRLNAHGDGSPGGTYLRVRNLDDTVYVAVWASAFTVNSSEELKRNIAKYDGDALDTIQQTPVFRYSRVTPSGEVTLRNGKTKSHKETLDPPQVGLVAEQAHADIVNSHTPEGLGIDLYSMTSVLWAGVQQLHDRVKELEAKQ